MRMIREIRPPLRPRKAPRQSANTILQRISFGQSSLAWTITPVLALPRTAAFYSTNYPTMLDDARIAAANSGFNPSDYDRDLLSPPPMLGWSQGMAVIGSRSLYVSVADGGLVVHELGHTFGLPHANTWDTSRPNPFQLTAPPFQSNISLLNGSFNFETNSFVGRTGVMFPGLPIEYGDPFDIMASSSSKRPADFNVNFKLRLGWVSSNQVKTVSSSGVHRLYSQHVPNLNPARNYGLRIDKLIVGRAADHVPRQYWMEDLPSVTSKFFCAGLTPMTPSPLDLSTLLGESRVISPTPLSKSAALFTIPA